MINSYKFSKAIYHIFTRNMASGQGKQYSIMSVNSYKSLVILKLIYDTLYYTWLALDSCVVEYSPPILVLHICVPQRLRYHFSFNSCCIRLWFCRYNLQWTYSLLLKMVARIKLCIYLRRACSLIRLTVNLCVKKAWNTCLSLLYFWCIILAISIFTFRGFFKAYSSSISIVSSAH